MHARRSRVGSSYLHNGSVSDFGGDSVLDIDSAGRGDGTVEAAPPDDMLKQLNAKTGIDFAASENYYKSFIASARIDVQNTDFVDRLSELHGQLTKELVVGKIRAIDAWADGETSFTILPKPWESVLDKLYRLNVEDNDEQSLPPQILSIEEQANNQHASRNKRWVTPELAHEFADDLLRTKFVVPFVDGVMDVSKRVIAAARECDLVWFQRYHAKDSGYHAHHVYVLLPILDRDEKVTQIALEIKVLTKLQDNLGELTHLLYELKRTGKIKSEKKRKLAWMLDSPDFTASYVGHSAHYIEAAMVGLKKELAGLESERDQYAKP